MPATAMCAAHGLRFDPELSTGCVLCKRAAAARPAAASQAESPPEQVAPQFDPVQVSLSERLRDSPLLVVGLVLFGLGLSVVGYRWWRGPLVPSREIVLGGDRSAVLGRASRDCRAECAQASEVCFERCAEDDAACLRRCLDGAQTCDDGCGRGLRVGSPFYRYGRGDVPEWWALLDQFDKARPELLGKCGLSAEDNLRMRLTQRANKQAQVFVDFADGAKAQCAAGVLAANFDQPGRKDYFVVGTLSARPIDYATLLQDALNWVDESPGPAARQRAEVGAQAYTARRARQAAQEAQDNPRPAPKPQQLRVSSASQDAFAERRREYQLERERVQMERDRLLLERESRNIQNDELVRKHAQGHIGNEQQRWQREYRRDDRQAQREMWSEVERLRDQRESDEQRARWDRERKVREMEWRNRARARD